MTVYLRQFSHLFMSVDGIRHVACVIRLKSSVM